MKNLHLLLLSLVVLQSTAQTYPYADAIRPMIGTEGEGNAFMGPSLPFGMVKPGPDCDYNSNSGHRPIGKKPDFMGISHTHVSGTGGGPKYGNILVAPMTHLNTNEDYAALRKYEQARVGFYATQFSNDIKIKLTSTHSVAFHQYTFANVDSAWIKFDVGHFLGKNKNEGDEEQQQLVGSEIEIISPTQLRGYSRVKGGWNGGDAYTVYFYAEFDQPYTEKALYSDQTKIENTSTITDNHTSAKAFFRFKLQSRNMLGLKVAISYIINLTAI